jgi:hypothetical protein
MPDFVIMTLTPFDEVGAEPQVAQVKQLLEAIQ